MSTLKILLAEIGYRKLNFLFSLLAITVAAILFVLGPMLIDAYSGVTETELGVLQDAVQQSAQRLAQSEKEAADAMAELEDQTRITMRDMGFNLTILHRDAEAGEFLMTGLPSVDMPQEWIDTLAGDMRLTMVTHLVATLCEPIEFEGRTVHLVGYLPETPQAHKPLTAFAKKHFKAKTPMGYTIEPGTVQVGHLLAGDRKVGDTINIKGEEFRIAKILDEEGSNEDVTLAVHLSDAQRLLGLDSPAQINQILALECRCAEADLPAVRKQIRQALPDVQVIRDRSRANARARQRAMVKQKHDRIIATQAEALAEREATLAATAQRRENIQSQMETLARVVTPLVVLVSAIWVGLLALANVRERRVEIGILRALGKGSSTIASLFLGKAVLLGILGAAIGAAAGTAIAYGLGVRLLEVPPGQFHVDTTALIAALLGAPILAAAASYLPTLSALTQDPAMVLRER